MVVVSEETGTISIVVNGQITRNYSGVSAGAELKRLIIETKPEQKTGFVKSLLNRIKLNQKNNGKESEK